MRMALGQRLSGWVAANRKTIANSDAALDLGDSLRDGVRLRSCLSTPLISDGELVGVVAVYSAVAEAFSEDHRKILETVARKISNTFKRAAEFDAVGRRDPVTGLPNHRQLEQLAESARDRFPLTDATMTLMLIDVPGLSRINHELGRGVGDDVLRHVVKHARSNLRVADILFRYGSDELVALLDATDLNFAQVIADRIRHSVRKEPLMIGSERLDVDVAVACVCAPRDGDSVRDLMRSAKTQSDSNRGSQQSPTVH
jgi:diguanylate cyclase (GGDEF)-like protein